VEEWWGRRKGLPLGAHKGSHLRSSSARSAWPMNRSTLAISAYMSALSVSERLAVSSRRELRKVRAWKRGGWKKGEYIHYAHIQIFPLLPHGNNNVNYPYTRKKNTMKGAAVENLVT
jgi:hypothetical protein